MKFLTARWFLSLLGTLALAALVWFIGPLIAVAGSAPLESVTARVWVIVLLFVLWAAWQLTALLLARRRNRALVEQLAAPGAEPVDAAGQASAEELDTLRRRFDEALTLLKGSEGRKGLGGHWVYQLPWYLLIGPPGCGKTTALVNSGLKFPLAERLGQDPIAGVGGTRNCDWWFTDQAVLLDTAGRYTTQDSYAQVDSAAWGGFLALLKKHRPRRPINGVLLGLSLADLMQWTPAEREHHAKLIRQRIQELYGTFRLRFPIYVVFMKADLIAGFMEFFGDLNQDEREQVWGTTFPFNADPAAPPALAAFGSERGALQQRLEQHLLGRLQAERDARRRGLVFSFPRQFAAVGETVGQFLDACLDVTRFETRPLVRGVYFTSATQTGTPIDRILAGIAANFGLGRQAVDSFRGTPRSYFLTRLLREVVFPEAPLAGLDPRLEARRRWLRAASYAGAGVLALGAALAWTWSYLDNRAYIATVAGQVAAIEGQIRGLKSVGGPSSAELLAQLPLLDAARAISGGAADLERDARVTAGLGLDQQDKLGPQAQRAYRRLLNKTLLPAITLQLEERMHRSMADPDRLFPALRSYLMLADPDHYDPASLKASVQDDWAERLPRETTAEQRAALDGHLDALLATPLPVPLPLPLDGALIEQARGVLAGNRLAPRLYARLKASDAAAGLPDFSIARAGGDKAPLVLARRSGQPITQGIPALYTYDGYHQRFDNALAGVLLSAALDGWVLGPKGQLVPGTAESRALAADIRTLYLRDYIAQWKALLDDFTLIPPRDLPHAAQIAALMGDTAESPLRKVLTAAARETELDRRPSATTGGEVTGGVAKTVANAAADRAVAGIGGLAGVGAADLRRRLGEQLSAPPPPGTEAPETQVTRSFAWLHKLVQPGADGKSLPVDRALEGMAQLGAHLKAAEAAAASGQGGLAVGTGKEVQAAKEAAAAQPPAVAALLGDLVQDSAGLLAGSARSQINNLWTTEVLPMCQEALQGRYPFDPASRRDTTLADFAQVLGPEGLIATFFQKNLAAQVDRTRRPWRWTNPDLGIPNSVLAFFQRAQVIRDAFFGGGRKTPEIKFDLTPTSLDSRATQFTLDLGGQILDYRQGPRKSQTLKWPAPDGPGQARISFTGVDGKMTAQTEDGAWGWFRILDQARMQATGQPEIFRLTFTLAGLTAGFDLRAESVRNPFADLREVRGFACPERL